MKSTLRKSGNKLILAIETSCDETALALVEASGGLRAPKFKILKNLVASQIKIHRPFGGVVPNLAKREHLKNLPLLFNQLAKTKLSRGRKLVAVDLIAVTVGPGLEPALWTGVSFAKELGKELSAPVVGANHLEGHLYSFLLTTNYSLLSRKKIFSAIALIVSGGHTILLLLKSLTERKKLGETRDDAAGEAFDKVARLLGLPYPGGPEIEKLALRWIIRQTQSKRAHHGQARRQSGTIEFPRPMIHQKNYDFSFSGLKTAVLYYLRDTETIASKSINTLSRSRQSVNRFKTNVAASFQQAAIDVLVSKTMRAAQEYNAKSVLLSGGVAANKALRKSLASASKKIGANFFVPDFIYNTDNAAMIGVAAYINFLQGRKYRLVARGDMDI